MDQAAEKDPFDALTTTESELAGLLSLASHALDALLPISEAADRVRNEDGTEETEEESFLRFAKQYYETLDGIQLSLRSQIHFLSQTKSLPRPSDFVPPPANQAPLPSLAASLLLSATSTDDKDIAPSTEVIQKGLYALRAEKRAWEAVRDSLRQMNGKDVRVKGEETSRSDVKDAMEV